MELTQGNIKAELNTKQKDFQAFARAAQEDINKRQETIQNLQQELQNVVKAYQSEVDKRQGAIDLLKDLAAPAETENPKPKKAKKG